MYKIVYTKAALKAIRQIPKSYIKSIVEHISELEANPHPHGSILLEGSKDKYRIRVGMYRIIYAVMDDELVIEIIKIGHRKDVYR